MKKLNIAIVGLEYWKLFIQIFKRNREILSKIIVFQILFLFQQKTKIEKEILKLKKNNGLKITLKQPQILK